MKNFLVIGMGEFGKHVAFELLNLGNEVCIVDTDPDVINVLANNFQNAIVTDGMVEMNLIDLGVENYDAVIVGVGDFQASLEITSRLNDLKAKRIIAKSTSDIQSKFLKIAGATETVYPEKDMAERIAAKCNAKNLFDHFRLAKGYSINELPVPKAWVGNTLIDLKIRNKYDVNIVLISNSAGVFEPSASYVFKKDDHIFIFGEDERVEKLSKSI